MNVAAQQFPLIEDTFRRFTSRLRLNIGDRMKMNSVAMEFVEAMSVELERKILTMRMIAGVLAGAILCLSFVIPANASCRDSGVCSKSVKAQTHAASHKVAKHKTTRHKTTKHKSRHRPSGNARLPAASGRVVSLITATAPSYGVPAWFALRIAKIESNYNPRLRGAAGEYGVFQLKCATAKGIGFRGNCAALLDPGINVRYGLKHLALAMKSSRGNLRLAASKHNGGLGRKTEVRGYIAKVF